MTDYREMAIGTKFSGREGEVVECPYCHLPAWPSEDYVYPISTPPQKEKIYAHFDFVYKVPRENANGEIVYDTKIGENACRESIKSQAPKS
jgi:hypothetical protein